MTFTKKTIKDISLAGKTVLVRADYNVPIDAETGEIRDDLRVRASVPTIQYLLDRGAKVVIMSHLGRPDGKPNERYTLEHVAAHLSELIGREVVFIATTVGDGVKQAVKVMRPGDVVMLENLRFDPGEEANSTEFAEAIAQSVHPDLLVQDGFGVVHRAHASTVAITNFVPAVAGLLLEKEYTIITEAMQHPRRPLYAVMGGAKVSDKIKVIEAFVAVADKILIGGAMANTFLAHHGANMGDSMVESGETEVIDAIYTSIKKKHPDLPEDEFLWLPTDVAVAKKIDKSEKRRVVPVNDLADDDIALDIGDETIEHYTAMIRRPHTIVWNGTLGYAELPEFAHGSARMAMAIAAQSHTTSIVGGGDTADFVLKWSGGEGDGFTHVSTGGGASLDLMAGKKLPGVEALLDAS